MLGLDGRLVGAVIGQRSFGGVGRGYCSDVNWFM